jgi:hypothetical protein
LVKATFYFNIWILKLLPKASKFPPFGDNSTSPTGTAPPGTAPAGVIASGITDNDIDRTDVDIDFYELNKLNIGKPNFTENEKIIVRYKFKYFKKNNKKN